VPHLGWNSWASATGAPRLLHGIAPDRQLFYFANAYAVAPTAAQHGASALYHHCRDWVGLVELGSIHDVQFHPEKSRSQGLQLLRNFLSTV
jgi:glutamine amidotransferase